MAYYMVRLYTGSGGNVEQVMQSASQEIAPKLKDIQGFQRYLAGVADDGLLISASLFDSKTSAERSVEVTREVALQSDVLKTQKLKQAFGGEIVRDDGGSAEGQHVTHGLGVILRTSTPAELVADTIIENRSDELKRFEGRVRTLFVQLDDGRVMISSGFTSQDARNKWSTATSEAVGNNESIKRLFGNNPEEINMTVHVHQS